FELLRGERLAILGENGTGKTTLLKTLAGRLPALAGSSATGHDVSIGYYDQLLSDLDPARRAIDAVWDEHPEATEEAMRSYLALFAFRGDEVFAKIGSLSGGEKGRLTLAVVMKQDHNLLLLDEPTNHLDLDSREALEEALDGFPGSIVFVSHDRAFIDRLATRVLDLRGGRALQLPGNYSETAAARTLRRLTLEPPFAAPLPYAARVPPAPVVPPPTSAGRKDSGSAEEKEAAKRRKRVSALESRIALLEKEVEAIEARLYEEALTLGPVASNQLAGRRRDKKEEIERLVDEWATA
ncbi:MAG TPA: ATP-binding cassette domain-containing protein, partial [Thermoanaerobaculia bacterium]|nr:ATP-binding cassette domain-containing protein [Thermoanaerobaculia bacterium]